MAVKDGVKSYILTLGVDLCRISIGICVGYDTFLDVVWCEEYDG